MTSSVIAADLGACTTDPPKACAIGNTESTVTEVDTEEAVAEEMVVQLLQTHAVHTTHIPNGFDHFMQYFGKATNSTFHTYRMLGDSLALLRTNFVRTSSSTHVEKLDCKGCAAGFDRTMGCGAIYDAMHQKIDRPTFMSTLTGSFPEPGCMECKEFNPEEVCSKIWAARHCEDCGSGFDRDGGCGAMYSFRTGKLSEKEAMAKLFDSFPCGEDMKECDFDLQSACGEWTAAQLNRCTDRENCDTCLYSWQCKGYGGNPSPIYCCPRMKRCIDVTPEGVEAGRQGCFGDRTCPDMCSESPYRSPHYPFDCGDKCPGWDPMTWVTC